MTHTPPPVTEGNYFLVRATLDNIPVYRLPDGCALRWYQPGDEADWLAIHAASYAPELLAPTTFRDWFGGDEDALRARQCYLLNRNGEPIGTATAWYDDIFWDSSYGRVHWVAMHPAYQGRGLANPLMTVICQRMRELGHTRAYLTTGSTHPAAHRLYATFGFVKGTPAPRTPQ